MSKLSIEAEKIISDAEKSGDTISVLIDDDWYLVRWISDAYNGSNYGCSGFADENDYHLGIDIFDDARLLSDASEFLSTDEERINEKVQHEADRQEWIRLELKYENRKKRAEREEKRTALIQRYIELAGHEPLNTNLHVLRSNISQMEAIRIQENISKLFANFNIH